MGMTIAHKIIASHLVGGEMTPGSEIALKIDQTLTQDAGLTQRARENSISTGKAALVNRVLALNSALKFDALAKLSVEELKDLAEAGAPAMPIGMDAARTAAEEYAGTTALDSVAAEVDPELDESPAHYEVELQTAWGEFEYLVDAYTGKVLSGQKDLLAAVSASSETTKPSGQKPAPSGTVQDIGYAKAKSIALNHAGLSENQAYDMDIELDDEDGKLVYEIEFKSGNMEYDYEIDAASGTILKHEVEREEGGVDRGAVPARGRGGGGGGRCAEKRKKHKPVTYDGQRPHPVPDYRGNRTE